MIAERLMRSNKGSNRNAQSRYRCIRKEEMYSIKDTTHFDQRLAEAVAWCCTRAVAADPKNSLRYDSLYPNILSETRADVVLSVLMYRGLWLQPQRVKPVTKDLDLRHGRLLCYFPDANLADGAAEVTSEGFFDSNNIPPWDTWVGLYRSDLRDASQKVYLISYVPEVFLHHASTGIEVNPEGCILWLGGSDTPIGNLLRSEGWRF